MPRSVPRFLTETAELLPDKLAVWEEGNAITFAELHEGALATAECLREPVTALVFAWRSRSTKCS